MNVPTRHELLHPDAGVSSYLYNRQLFAALSDDVRRASLYRDANEQGVMLLPFIGRAKRKDGDRTEFHQKVYLVLGNEAIKSALSDHKHFGNMPYRALGSGTFMLGLEPKDSSQAQARGAQSTPDDPHAAQRKLIGDAFRAAEPYLLLLFEAAWQAAATLPLKTADFDLADLAEQAATRLVGMLFGFALSDHPVILAATAKAYRGLNYQIFGRHFVSAPAIEEEAKLGMGALFTRCAELIDQYQSGELSEEIVDFKKEIRKQRADHMGKRPEEIDDFVPVLESLAQDSGDLSGSERAVVAAGTIVGFIGNVQAAVCIAINHFFGDAPHLKSATEAAQRDDKALHAMVMEALRANPPAAFLPRQVKETEGLSADWKGIKKGDLLILAMGSATQGDDGDDLVFGGAVNAFAHRCLGRHLAEPIILRILKGVLQLPNLIRAKDPLTGLPVGLKKLWGFKCESLPMHYKRDERLVQQPLNVVMRVKAPIAVNAEKLKVIIKNGAPRIELELRKSRHVHFAWFMFFENDSKLALMTTYDGDFDAYVDHFAQAVGPLFDRLFEHIDDAPPLPVRKFRKEFIQKIKRYNAAPVAGYFFSAYPMLQAARIVDGLAAGGAKP